MKQHAFEATTPTLEIFTGSAESLQLKDQQKTLSLHHSDGYLTKRLLKIHVAR